MSAVAREAEILILGGGCAGISLFLELSDRGYSCILVESDRLGTFASTRNQSWLHSGAWYALRGAPANPIVTACKEGYFDLTQFCERFSPSALETNSGCIFLFDHPDSLARAAASLQHLGLSPQVLSQDQIYRKEPFLSSTIVRFGLLAPDIPFDSHKILTELTREALRAGGAFHFSPTKLSDLKFSYRLGAWTVEDGSSTLKAPVLICAAGAHLPVMLRRILWDTSSWAVELSNHLRISTTQVAVFHKRLCERIISIQAEESKWLNMVPFGDLTTVTLGNLDTVGGAEPDSDVLAAMRRDYEKRLSHFFPGLLQHGGCPVHFYVCEKLNNINDPRNPYPMNPYGARHYFWLEDADHGFFCFYPGKFITARVAARRLADRIAEVAGEAKAKSVLTSEAMLPPVELQAYYQPATHILTVKGSRISFTNAQ